MTKLAALLFFATLLSAESAHLALSHPGGLNAEDATIIGKPKSTTAIVRPIRPRS